MSLGARTRISVSFAFLHIFFTIDAFYLFNLTDILQISLLTKRWILYATIIEIKTLLSHAVFSLVENTAAKNQIEFEMTP